MKNRGLLARFIALSLTVCMVLCTAIVSYAEDTELSTDINWVRVTDNGSYMYVGIENSRKIFEPGSRFTVNKITRQNDPMKYDEQIAVLGPEIAEKINMDTVTMLEVSVKKSDGTEYKVLPETVPMYVQLSDRLDKELLIFNGISDGRSEIVESSFDRATTPVGPECCAKLTMKRVGCTLLYAEKLPEISGADGLVKALTKKTKVELNKVTSLKSGKIKLTFKRLTLKNGQKVREYQVFRKTCKNGKYKQIATITNDKTTKSITYTNGKNLKKGKRYYYKVRGVVTLSDGSLVYTQKSKAKSAKCRKSINASDVPTDQTEIVRVPGIVGRHITEAVEMLENAGLEADIIWIEDRTKSEGEVTNVDPSAHSQVRKGTTVKVFCVKTMP